MPKGSFDTTLKDISAIDLFCGVGGLTHGLIRAGIPVLAGIDIDESCKYAYEINNHTRFIQADIGSLASDDISKLYPKGHIKVLAGCAPCQPFSNYSQKYANRKKNDKWNLLYPFCRIIRGVEPHIISIENVPQLVNHEPFEELLSTLKKLHYNVFYRNVRCEEYGIPQRRLRLVLLASKFGEIDLIPTTHGIGNYVTLKDVIGRLEKINAGECSQKDPLHRARGLSPLNRSRISNSRPGGTWRDWDRELLCDCHTKDSGGTFSAVYGRMSWDKPASTITTQFYNYGSGRFGHPEQNRALSLREGALLQTFPENYVFADTDTPLSFDRIGRYIGNAVPVLLGEVIGKSILRHIRGEMACPGM